ncbi:MAG: hypothetical protein ACPLXS_01045 [Candidatus Micrarchaeales archaeon]
MEKSKTIFIVTGLPFEKKTKIDEVVRETLELISSISNHKVEDFSPIKINFKNYDSIIHGEFIPPKTIIINKNFPSTVFHELYHFARYKLNKEDFLSFIRINENGFWFVKKIIEEGSADFFKTFMLSKGLEDKKKRKYFFYNFLQIPKEYLKKQGVDLDNLIEEIYNSFKNFENVEKWSEDVYFSLKRNMVKTEELLGPNWVFSSDVSAINKLLIMFMYSTYDFKENDFLHDLFVAPYEEIVEKVAKKVKNDKKEKFKEIRTPKISKKEIREWYQHEEKVTYPTPVIDAFKNLLR